MGAAATAVCGARTRRFKACRHGLKSSGELVVDVVFSSVSLVGETFFDACFQFHCGKVPNMN